MKKTIKNLSLLCTCLIFLGVTSSFAEGTDAAAFLKKSVGVKAIGMGGAFTSIADDTSAVYWNPAGLAQVQDFYSVYAMGTTGASDKYDGLSDVIPTHQFFALSVPLQKFTDVLGKTVIGVGYISSQMDAPLTNEQAQVLGTISDTDNAYYLSAGLPLWQSTTSLYIGATLKYITKNMSSVGVSTGGLDIDVGVIYSVDAADYGLINFGAIFQKGVDMGDYGYAPTTTKVGVSDKVLFADKFQLTGAVDLVQRQKEPLSSNAGLEFGVLHLVNTDAFGINGIFLRGGLEGYAIENRYDITSDYNETVSYNFGLGFEFSIMKTILQLDIAICSGNIFDQNTKFALNFFF